MAVPLNKLLTRLQAGSVRTRLLFGGLVVVAISLVLGVNLAANSESALSLVAGSLVILVLASVGLHILGGRVLGSLDDLLSAAQRMAGGDATVRAPSSDSEMGRLGRYLNVLVDRQKVTVGQVEGSRRKLEDLLGSLPLEIALFDARGRYLYQKPATGEPSGKSRLALGMTATELYTMRDQAALGHQIDLAVEECIEGGEVVTLHQQVTGDQGLRELTRVLTPVDPDRSDAVRVVAYTLDVSDQRRAEATLRERNEQLREAQKLESIGRLAGGVAEDFDQLLTSILSSVEVALGVDSVPDAARTNIESVRSDALQAKIFAGQLLAFGRKQVLRPEIVDVTVLVREAEMMLRRILGRHIRVDSSHVDESVLVDADPSKVEQVLMRLALNARDAMSDGGRLTLRTTVADFEERPKGATGSFEPGPYAVISVGDTGKGMEPEALARVFEPFSAVTPGRAETGLGLSAVEGTISQSGGFLTVESKVGEGTTFRIHLQRVGVGVESATPKPVQGTPVGSGHRGIALLAVADELLREFIRRTLERVGFEVLAADQGDVAIDLARGHEGPIALFVVDVSVEGVGAADIVRVVSSFQPDVHILAVSASSQGATEHHAALGRILHLKEPFESGDLLDAVDRSLQDRLTPQAGVDA